MHVQNQRNQKPKLENLFKEYLRSSWAFPVQIKRVEGRENCMKILEAEKNNWIFAVLLWSDSISKNLRLEIGYDGNFKSLTWVNLHEKYFIQKSILYWLPVKKTLKLKNK